MGVGRRVRICASPRVSASWVAGLGVFLTFLAGCAGVTPATTHATGVAQTVAPSPSPSPIQATPTAAPSPSPSPTANPVVLNPATTPSVVGTCSQQLSFGADGNAGPIICTNGAVNVLAWNYFITGSAGLFSAGSDATPGQIEQLESSAQGWTGPIGQSVYCLAAA